MTVVVAKKQPPRKDAPATGKNVAASSAATNQLRAAHAKHRSHDMRGKARA